MVKQETGTIEKITNQTNLLALNASIEETLILIQITLEKVTQTGDNVNQIASDSAQLGNHIQVVDNAIKEVESSNTQLVSNMEQVSNIVETITGCIAHSSQTSERMLRRPLTISIPSRMSWRT